MMPNELTAANRPPGGAGGSWGAKVVGGRRARAQRPDRGRRALRELNGGTASVGGVEVVTFVDDFLRSGTRCRDTDLVGRPSASDNALS